LWGFIATRYKDPNNGFISADPIPGSPPLKPRVFVHGITIAKHHPVNPQASGINEYVALSNRQLCSVLRSQSWVQHYELIRGDFDGFFPRWSLEEVSFEQWNNRPSFTATRKRNHQIAYDTLLHEPINKNDHFASTFIKTEILRSCEDPRNIVQKSDRFNAAFGPALYAFSKALARSWNKDHWIFYTSGAHAEDISDWIYGQCQRLSIDFDTCYKIVSDQKRQDGHVTRPALEWEILMFEMLGLDYEIIEGLKSQYVTIGFSSDGIFFMVEGTRQTGMPHTSSGNSMMNAVMNIIMLIQQLPPIASWYNPPFAIMVQGDDIFILCVEAIVPFIDSDRSIQIAASMGFLVKFYDTSTQLHELDYCSRYFWPTDSHLLGYVLGPKIGKVLNKIGYSRTATKCQYARNRGIVLSMYKDVQHIPFLREWSHRLLQLTEGVTPEELPYTHSIHSRKASELCSRSLSFLYRKYGLTDMDLYIWQQELSKVTSLPYHIEVDWVDEVLDIDYA